MWMVSKSRKTDKLLLNLEKQRHLGTTVRRLIDDNKDITDLKEINVCICKFWKNVFKKNVSKSDSERESFLNSVALPNLNPKSLDILEREITEKDVIIALKSMPNGKSPGHDGLTKEFYEHFWVDLKFYFINSLKQSENDSHLFISPRQAIINLIAKKDRDKNFSKTGDQFRYLMLKQKYFLNYLQKIWSMNQHLPELISSSQTFLM